MFGRETRCCCGRIWRSFAAFLSLFFFPFPFLFLFFSPSPDLRPSRRENFSRNFGYARWRRGFVSRPASPRYISSFRFNFNSTVFINRCRTVRVNFRRNIPGGGKWAFFFFSSNFFFRILTRILWRSRKILWFCVLTNNALPLY